MKDAKQLLTSLLIKVKPVCSQQHKSEKDIHDARVAIKRLKARLRILPLKKKQPVVFERLYQLFTEINHSLAGRRDLDMALSTLKNLTDENNEKSISQSIKWLQHAFEQQQVIIKEDNIDLSTLYSEINQIINAQAPIKLNKSGLNKIIQHSWERTCLAGETALQTKQMKDLHSWRKRSKTLQYHAEVLDDKTHNIDQHRKILTRLGSTLGKLHDFLMLQTMINQAIDNSKSPPDMDGLTLLIEEQKHQLLASCSRHHRSLCYSTKT